MRALVGILAVLAVLILPGSGAAAPDARALGFLSDIVNSDDAAVVSHFNPTLRATLPAGRLKAAWAAYELQFGSYVGHGEPQTVALGTSTVVRVPLEMSRRRGEFRITFEANGQIAGLYFLRTGVPL